MPNSAEHENKKGRKPVYLTVECFERFRRNEFHHLDQKVNYMFIILLATFGASLARLFWG